MCGIPYSGNKKYYVPTKNILCITLSTNFAGICWTSVVVAAAILKVAVLAEAKVGEVVAAVMLNVAVMAEAMVAKAGEVVKESSR